MPDSPARATVKGRAVNVLLVEDSAGDIALTRRALQQAKVHNELSVVTDGDDALDFLRRSLGKGEEARPDLVLLDLNLPRRGGLEVLREMKQDPELRRIPVVILTTSDDEHDVLRSYDLQASAFITKPVDFQAFLRVVASLDAFWLEVVTFPPN